MTKDSKTAIIFGVFFKYVNELLCEKRGRGNDLIKNVTEYQDLFGIYLACNNHVYGFFCDKPFKNICFL